MIVYKTNSDRLIAHYHLDVGDYANEAGDSFPHSAAGVFKPPDSDSRPRLWVISQPCQILFWLFRYTGLQGDRSPAIPEHSSPAT
jgi:hypothetical protein